MRIGGRYRLGERVGQGGMGRVWRARDEMLERPVAVKELWLDGPDAAEDPRTRRERALREARASARIDHPGVVRVYDVAEEDDRLWIVMELVEAPSLERTVAEKGPLGVRETARIGLALAEALRRVHTAGVLHRDVKPGNVLLGPGPRVVLTDFGIAALQDAPGLTGAGMVIGSPEYLSPERATGRDPGPASDWWSLGATLCTALTGHSPFARPSMPATLLAVVYEEPELPGGDCPLTPLLRGLLAKDPALRPGADEIVAFLTALLARPEPVAEPPPDAGSRLLTALVLIAAAALAVVMVITAIPSGGETRLPEVTPTPTVAGTYRPPSSPATTPAPR